MKMMTRKPSAIWHMIRWGFLSGIILAISFMVFILGLSNLPNSPIIWQEAIWIISVLAFFFGGIPGTILGLIEGWVLGNLLRDIPYPFTKSDMNKKRWPIYIYIFFVPIITIIALAALVSGGSSSSGLAFLSIFSIPTLIASIASVYAAHRYLFRLRLWSGDFDMQKTKAKHKQIDNSRLELQDDDEDYVVPEIKPSEQRNDTA